jgi:hypothetical protein
MNGETGSLWLIVVVVTGAIGTAMALYGIRQKEPLPLVFGIAIGIVPMVVSSGWVAAVLALAAGTLFVVVRKYR